MSLLSISPREALLLIIDIQEKLCRVMNRDYLARICSNINLLTTLSQELSIPLLLTQQYPQGLGPTIEPVQKILEGKKVETLDKTTFGCCEDSQFLKKLKTFQRKKIILVGMETHVCVYLTALGLLKNGFYPFVVSDAVISRESFHYKNGLQLASQAGAVVTNTETLLFQLMVESGSKTFKKISSLLKSNSQ